MKLLLVRHGATDWSEEGRYQGHSDRPLSPLGRAQARALAQVPCCLDVTRVVSSPLARAVATAREVAARICCDVTTDERLTEMGYGQWEGLRQSDIKGRWPELLRAWKRTPERVRFPGGESLDELRERVRAFLASWPEPWAVERPGSVLAISHAGFIRVAVLELRGMPLSNFRAVAIAPASVTVCDLAAGRLEIETLNAVSHLAHLS